MTKPFLDMSKEDLLQELQKEKDIYESYQSKGLHLDMARGKPCAKQLDLSEPMLTILKDSRDCISEDGVDCRNYGIIDGIPEARELMSWLFECDKDDVIVFGNSSLTVMYDTIARCLDFGCLGSKPWFEYDHISWICPVPGYDRHFSILEQFGIEMITVPIDSEGPDMDEVERIAASDERVKGIWCIPKYSNPSGVSYSDDTIRRLASMSCAASDFRIFWDNAYCVHDLYPDASKKDHILSIDEECKKAGNPNRVFQFASTSKITFPGAGIAGFASSSENVAEVKRLVSAQMIGQDKLNQLRHVRFLPTKEALISHMSDLADIIRPKFESVERILSENLSGLGIADWTDPNGGYFVSFDGYPGTAKRTVELCKQAGVTLTGAGATWPYGNDPNDSNIRIAPTMPPIEDLEQALDVFVCCVKIAALERIIEEVD